MKKALALASAFSDFIYQNYNSHYSTSYHSSPILKYLGLLNGAVLGLLSFAFIGLYLVVLKVNQ